jgi:hypothetical protein
MYTKYFIYKTFFVRHLTSAGPHLPFLNVATAQGESATSVPAQCPSSHITR